MCNLSLSIFKAALRQWGFRERRCASTDCGESASRRCAVQSRLRVEPLEERRLLSVVAWDGEGATPDWHDPINWVGDELPGATDDAQIDASFAGTTISSDADVDINSLSSEATLRIDSASFSVAAGSQTSALELTAGTLTGAGDLI